MSVGSILHLLNGLNKSILCESLANMKINCQSFGWFSINIHVYTVKINNIFGVP